MKMLVIVICMAPVIGWFFRVYINRFNGFFASINVLLLIAGMIIISSGGRNKIKLSSLFVLTFLYYVITVLMDSYVFNSNPFELRNFYSNQELLLVLFILCIDNANIKQELAAKIIKYLYFLFFLSLIVILYQQLVNPLFLIITTTGRYRSEAFINSIQFRNQSLYGLVGSEAVGYSFNSIYAVLLNDSLHKKKKYMQLILFVAAFAHCFMARSRYVMIFFFIVSLQFVFWYRLKAIRNYIAAVFSIAALLFILNVAGVPVEQTIRIRYLDEDVGGIPMGSWRAREDNYRVFAKYISSGRTILTGVYLSDKDTDYYNELGREVRGDFIGILAPLTTYGILGSLPLYLFYMVLLWQLYRFGLTSKNFSYFLIIVGLWASASSFGNLSVLDMGIMIALILYNYERRALKRPPELSISQPIQAGKAA